MADFPKKAEDNVNVLTTVIIGGVSALVMWASVIALQAYYDATGGELEMVRSVENQSRELRQARSEHLADLVDYRYVDAKTGAVKLPIERAMQLVAQDARGGKGTLVPAVGSHDTPTVPLPGQTMPDAGLPPNPPVGPEGAVEGSAEGATPGTDAAAAPAAGAPEPGNIEGAPDIAAEDDPGAATARAGGSRPAPAEEGSAN